MNRGRKLYNLVLVTDQETNQVLLGYKKRGFGVGIWSGFGGKVNHGEDIQASVRRELFEESSLVVKEMTKVGILCFDSDTYSDIHEAHVYQVTSYSGIPMESEEMKPGWFPIDSIPYHLLWKDFKFWWPYFRSGSLFSGFFMYKGLECITDHRLITVKDVKELAPINLIEETINTSPPSIENHFVNISNLLI